MKYRLHIMLVISILALSLEYGGLRGVSAMLPIAGVTAVRNNVSVSSFGVSSSVLCRDLTHSCFSIQQNFDIITPSSYPQTAYAGQNSIFVENDLLGGLHGSSDFEVWDYTTNPPHLLSCKSVSSNCGGESEQTTTLPASWAIVSSIDSSGKLTMSNNFDTVGFAYSLPQGTVMYNEEILFVGSGTNGLLGTAIATFSSFVGNVDSSIKLTGMSGWLSPYKVISETTSQVASYETSKNLRMSVSGNSASISFIDGALDQGIAFYPYNPQAKISQPPQSNSDIVLGQSAMIKVYVQNQADIAYWMTIQIEFPGVTDSSIVQSTVSDVPCSPGSQTNCVFVPGTSLGAAYGTSTATLNYVIVEVMKNPWPAGETHYVSVTVRPTSVGVFKFRVKSVATTYYLLGQADRGSSDPSFVTTNPPSEQDAQSEWAYIYTINVKPPQYAITVNTSPSGLDSPQGGGTYNQGTQITISVSNVNGYTFQKWQRDGVDYGTQQSFQYSVDASHTFTAIFTQNGCGNPPSPQYPSNSWNRVWCTYTGDPNNPWGAPLSGSDNPSQPNFDENWGTGNVDGTGQSDNVIFSSGMTYFLNNGVTFTLTVGSDDGSRLYIDGILMAACSSWQDQSYTTKTCSVVGDGAYHSFRLDYYENSVDARVTFNIAYPIVVQSQDDGGGTSHNPGGYVDISATSQCAGIPAWQIDPPSTPQIPSGSYCIKFLPDTNYVFSSWQSSGGVAVTQLNPVDQFGSAIMTITGSGSLTLVYHYASVTTMTVSYSIVGGGTPSPPVFNYVQGAVSQLYTLTTTPTAIQVDPGTSWSVGPNPLAGSTSAKRWESNQPLSGTASSSTIVFTFYKQSLYTLSYSVVGGGSGYSAPSFSANVFGAFSPQPLTNTPTGYWFDAASPWTVTNPLSGSSSTEEWVAGSASGKIGASQTLLFQYQHQYWLSTLASPSSGGTVSPGSGWQNAGASVQIQATPNTGFGFSSWTGTGSGSYSGSSNPATVVMNGAITETANFGSAQLPQLTVTLVNPSNGASVLANTAMKLKVKVTSSGSVIQGATVTVYVDGGQVCSGKTNLNGVLNCSFTPPLSGHTYSWYASSSKTGYTSGTSQTWTFHT